MTEQFDVVVAGAGHNSLITAAYLVKAGLSCLFLEARPVVGGNTMTEELTLPGFLHDTCSTTHPGGSVTGAPGRNAAMVLLKDLGRDLNEVIKS